MLVLKKPANRAAFHGISQIYQQLLKDSNKSLPLNRDNYSRKNSTSPLLHAPSPSVAGKSFAVSLV